MFSCQHSEHTVLLRLQMPTRVDNCNTIRRKYRRIVRSVVVGAGVVVVVAAIYTIYYYYFSSLRRGKSFRFFLLFDSKSFQFYSNHRRELSRWWKCNQAVTRIPKTHGTRVSEKLRAQLSNTRSTHGISMGNIAISTANQQITKTNEQNKDTTINSNQINKFAFLFSIFSSFFFLLLFN